MKIFGILNITEDSFSDGGKYLESSESIKQAEALIRDGAAIIDIGAQSSNIHSQFVSPEVEWTRIQPVLEFLKEKKIPVSIDTFKPEIIQKCLEHNVDYINDITALQNPLSREFIQGWEGILPDFVLMYSHNQGLKAQEKSHLQCETILDEIISFMDNKRNEIIKLGISENKLIFDPGMGFFLGEDPELSFTVLRNLAKLKKEFPRILISVSRKSFLGKVLGGIPPLERGNASLMAEFYAYIQGVEFIRTHSPLPLVQAIQIWDHIHYFN